MAPAYAICSGLRSEQCPHSAQRQCDPGGPADRREQQALDQQLAHQRRGARAERGAQRDLVPAAGRLRQLQVGDVDAADEEHEGGGRQQDQQRLAQIAVEPFPERPDAHRLAVSHQFGDAVDAACWRRSASRRGPGKS